MARSAVYHNTPDEIRQYLTDALNVVTELDPPTDLREAVFTKAVDLRASKTLTMDAPPTMGVDLENLRRSGLVR